MADKDSIYSQPFNNISDFVFDDKVANVFEDMINRSVPGYGAIINMIGLLAQQYVKSNTNCYDLGCSLGASTLSMANNITEQGVQVIAVDNSESMISKCMENIKSKPDGVHIELLCDDIRKVNLTNASMVVLNFTLQFIERDDRMDLIKKIYDSMLSGGVLVLSEKVAFYNEHEEIFQTEMHHTFKRLNGYSDMEISQKRTALEKVLIPDTIDEHVKRLNLLGFRESFVWFQCFNFISLVAIK